MRRCLTLGFLLSALTVTGAVRGGHELPVYPSYYPHEIEIRTVAPDAAENLLRQSKIHAYLGSEFHLSDPAPDLIATVESLGSLVTVRINPQSTYARVDATACAVTRAVAQKIGSNNPHVILHPYPITPLHGDYLYHVDLAEAAKRRLLSDTQIEPTIQDLKMKAADASAKRLLGAEKTTPEADWDVEIRETSLPELAASAMTVINGWLVPPVDGTRPISFCATPSMPEQKTAWKLTFSGSDPAISLTPSIASTWSGRSSQPSSATAVKSSSATHSSANISKPNSPPGSRTSLSIPLRASTQRSSSARSS